MSLAAEFMRPGYGSSVDILNAKSTGNSLKILVKGYEEPGPVLLVPEDESSEEAFGEDFDKKEAQYKEDDEDSQDATPAQRNVAEHMFKVLRGSNNLVFPNSRRDVELYTHLLNQMSHKLKLPMEFWPHHGSLSKEIRAEAESALKQRDRPATAVCTNTLELGIDIGSVKSVVQVNAPPSVASIRQRLGRSGRRGESAILRGYCIESEFREDSTVFDQLRLKTVQVAAMTTLLTEAWFEPPPSQGLHLSTLVQQILSTTAQKSGLTIGALYHIFCADRTPFKGLDKKDFSNLIRHMGTLDLLMQDKSGLLLHGKTGEDIVNDYKFYAAFSSEEEYRVIAGGRSLGTLPVSQMLVQGQRLLFAAKTWIVDNVNETEKVIHLSKASGGAPPAFTMAGGQIHTVVRQRMRDLLESNNALAFLDTTAQRFLTEARVSYQALDLGNTIPLEGPKSMLLFTWLGSATNEALACMLRASGMTAYAAGPAVEISKKDGTTSKDVVHMLYNAATLQMPSLEDMLPDVTKIKREKWDWALPDDLLRKAYASIHLNLEEAQDWSSRLQP
jgi:ATP-dependent Lhr-like helicase